ncbi:protein kinase domain-containing protein [Xylanibacter oryzae]|uniref:protein kinase domain-containing protein n=1 Tax=Xylanibacter oryzae TaxID=185293 RepID=UPI0004BB73CB|nr:hypothetical protein [Xylanibacter oryzae]
MNYEELIEARDAKTQNLGNMPIGNIYKRHISNKYINILKIKDNLINNFFFSGDINFEYQVNQTIKNKHQLHFSPIFQGEDIVALKIEMCNFQSFESLLSKNPAVVGSKHFISDTINDILNFTELLHKKNIYHVCYAPSTVLSRNGNNSVLFISHGSFYQNIKDRESLYGNYPNYIAPEVLNGDTIDERTDIYSIGKFIESLFIVSPIPFHYKRIVSRATKTDPEDRYQSINDMRHDLAVKKTLYKLILTCSIAAVLSIFGFTIWWNLTPKKTPIEFVSPAPRQATDDLIDDGFDPRTELGVITNDSVNQMSPAEQKKQAEYEKKNEEIFRKRYTLAAAKIINKIYNKKYMGNNEKKFVAGSQATLDDLSKLQTDLGAKAHLPDSKSQRIAAEVIEGLTEQKMYEMK